MVFNFLTKVFGSKNERELNKIKPAVEMINKLETDLKAMSDQQLSSRTSIFKDHIARKSDKKWTGVQFCCKAASGSG